MALRKVKQSTILNAKGEPIVLNAKEQYHANYMQRMVNERFGNALGYEIPITTLTTVVKKVSEQKLYTIPFADYFPVRVGEGAWSSNLVTYRSFDIADQFESGILNTGGQSARQSVADASVDSLNIKVQNWGKTIQWSIFDLELAAKSGNWDIVAAKEKARKRNWDLGIQRVAFLGAKGLNGPGGSALGLLNQAGVTFASGLISQPLSSMTPTQLSTFQQQVITQYRINCNYTAMPNRFVIPESDYNGMAAQASPTFPMKTIKDLLEEGFKTITRNPDFKILPLVYCDKSQSGLATQMYMLYNADEESIRMDIPVDYTNTLANSLDNFSFQNAGYGQFTGVLAYRPAEVLMMGF